MGTRWLNVNKRQTDVIPATVQVGPELEALYVAASLEIQISARQLTTSKILLNQVKKATRYFRSLDIECPPLPSRLYKPMYDKDGIEYDLYEKIALTYLWWLRSQSRGVR